MTMQITEDSVTRDMTADEEAQWQADVTRMTTKTIKQQIEEKEATVTPRRLREAALGIDNGWMADLNTEITALRAQI